MAQMEEEKKNDRQYSGNDLCNMRDQLKNARDIFITLRETARFFFKPQDKISYNFGTQVAGKVTPQDPIGIRAHSILASGLYSNTINLSDEFFGYTLANKELAEQEDVKDWFSKCSEIAIQKLGSSNYGLSTFETIADYCAVCTGVQYSEMTKDKGLRFQNFMIDHCSIAEDKDGKVNTVFRDFELTAAQAVEKFGDAVPKTVMKRFEGVQDRYMKERYIHAVLPREGYSKENENMFDSRTWRYASYFIYEPDKKVLKDKKMEAEEGAVIVEESGYHTMPYAVPRFEKNYDNPYGRGLAFSSKGLMSSIDYLSALIADGVELKVSPPVFLPPGMTDQSDVDLTPAALNFYNPAYGLPIFYQSDIDLGSAMAYLEKMEKQLLEMWYADLFLMLEERKNMTATEVAERVAEKVQSILPVIARLYDELYSVTLTRVFYLLYMSQQFPDMPEALREVWGTEELRIHYTTKLDMKLAQLEISQIMKSLEEAGALLGMRAELPELDGVINVDEMLKDIFRNNNVSVDYIKTDKETEEFKAAQSAAAQDAMAMEQQQAMVKPIDVQASVASDSILAAQEGELATTGNFGYN